MLVGLEVLYIVTWISHNEEPSKPLFPLKMPIKKIPLPYGNCGQVQEIMSTNYYNTYLNLFFVAAYAAWEVVLSLTCITFQQYCGSVTF
jgi:hypothetical protein